MRLGSFQIGTARALSMGWGARVVGVGLAIMTLGVGAAASGPELVRMDQGIADRDPLSVSLRQLEPDIRQDLGFEHLYAEAANPDRFVRISGAMYAVSPRTDYVRLRSGVYPSVSPGTVFYIGAPPEQESLGGVGDQRVHGLSVSVSAPLSRPVRWSRPVSGAPMAVRVGAQDAMPRATPERPPVGAVPASRDMSNPSYRVARLREIARMMGSGQ